MVVLTRHCRVSSEVCRARRACSRASSVAVGLGLAAMIVSFHSVKWVRHSGARPSGIGRARRHRPVRDRRTLGEGDAARVCGPGRLEVSRRTVVTAAQNQITVKPNYRSVPRTGAPIPRSETPIQIRTPTAVGSSGRWTTRTPHTTPPSLRCEDLGLPNRFATGRCLGASMRDQNARTSPARVFGAFGGALGGINARTPPLRPARGDFGRPSRRKCPTRSPARGAFSRARRHKCPTRSPRPRRLLVAPRRKCPTRSPRPRRLWSRHGTNGPQLHRCACRRRRPGGVWGL